jgi:hypothetical protein
VVTCKKNLFKWLSESVNLLNADKEGVAHCWSETQLLRAWERPVQVEASSKVKELFPNMPRAEVVQVAQVVQVNLTSTDDVQSILDLTNTEDPEAGDLGVPFMQMEHEEEWTDWVRPLGWG